MNGNDGQTTGDARVDAALARFDELVEAPLTSHPEIFEDVHRRLQDALTGIEQDPPADGATGDVRTPNEVNALPSRVHDQDGRPSPDGPEAGRDVRWSPGTVQDPDAGGDADGWPDR